MIGKKFFLNAREGAFSEIPEPGSFTHSFAELKGHLVHVSFKQTTKGETMRLHIVNDLNFYCVSMFVRSRMATVFMLMARNLDVHSEMKFVMSREDGKDFFKIYQNESSIRWFYTEENKHELPTTDDEKRAFLRRIVEEELVPGLKKKLNPFPSHFLYKPFGTGNGLAGGYFDAQKSVATIRKNHLNEDDDKFLKLSYKRHFNQ